MYSRLFITALSVGLISAATTALALMMAPQSGPNQRDDTATAAAGMTGPALLVHTGSIRRQDGYDYIREFTGRAQATRSSDLGFDQGGRLIAVLVDEGEKVSPGAPLARLDTDRLSAQESELEAAHTEALADLALAKLTLGRVANIVDRGAVSQQGLDDAREAWRAAQARANRVQRQIERIRVDLSKAELHAPFAGIVTRRHVDEGRVLASGQPVLTLQEDRVPEIRVGVAGRLTEALRPGDVYRFVWRGQTIEARLRAVLPLRAATARTVDALFDPLIETGYGSPAVSDQYPVELRPGDLLRLELREHVDQPGFWLPITALTEGRHGLWSVYVPHVSESIPAGLTASHRVTRHSVDLVHQEADRVFVRGALRDGDQVVLDGLQRLVPNQWVRVAHAPVESLAQR